MEVDNKLDQSRFSTAISIIKNCYPAAKHKALNDHEVEESTGIVNFALAQRADVNISMGVLSNVVVLPYTIEDDRFLQAVEITPNNDQAQRSILGIGFNPEHSIVDSFNRRSHREGRTRFELSRKAINELHQALIRIGVGLTINNNNLLTVQEWRNINDSPELLPAG